MAEVALAKEPLEVAVGGGLDPFGAQRWLFMAVAGRVGFVALLAVLLVDQSTGGDGFGPGGEGVGAGVVLCGNAVPMRGSCGAEEQG